MLQAACPSQAACVNNGPNTPYTSAGHTLSTHAHVAPCPPAHALKSAVSLLPRCCHRRVLREWMSCHAQDRPKAWGSRPCPITLKAPSPLRTCAGGLLIAAVVPGASSALTAFTRVWKQSRTDEEPVTAVGGANRTFQPPPKKNTTLNPTITTTKPRPASLPRAW